MTSAQSSENILILIADDVGLEQIEAYGNMDPREPPTPNVTSLASQGVLFRNVWSNPMCSTTRATMQTGRYSFRTGIGSVVRLGTPGRGLPRAEIMLPEMLEVGDKPYTSGLFGKWHLGDHPDQGGLLTANENGWDHFHATMRNLDVFVGEDYFRFIKVEDGVESIYENYATSGTVDWFLDWVETAPEPWIAWVAFHAPHSPWHAPPEDLHTRDLSNAGPPEVTPSPYYQAMIEAMDAEIGRLMEAVDLTTTTTIFMGDNGGDQKTTVWQGGVNVPFIVAGPRVTQPGTESDALVNTTDMFATVAEINGIDLATDFPDLVHDSVSFLPYLEDPTTLSIREWVFTEIFEPNGAGPYEYHDRAIREARYKLVRNQGGEVLIDLELDPNETLNLLDGPLSPEEQEAYDYLRAKIAEIAASG